MCKGEGRTLVASKVGPPGEEHLPQIFHWYTTELCSTPSALEHMTLGGFKGNPGGPLYHDHTN